MDEELEEMMQDALSEIEELDNDTDTNEDQQAESTDDTIDEEENGDSGEDIAEDEGDIDQEGDNLDEEEIQDDEEESQEVDETINEDDQEEPVVDFEPIEVSVNGQTISINNKDEMLAFVKRGANSMNTPRARKSQNDQIIEQGKLSNEDLTLLIDAKNGNKAAIAKLAKDSGVDLYDIEDGGTYEPNFSPQFMSEADEVAEEMLQDTGFVETFQNIVKSVPADFVSEITSNASALRNFGEHVKSGLAQKIIPEALKQQMLHGGNFTDYYAQIGKQMYDADQKPSVENKSKRVENPRAKKLREQASNKKGSNKGQRTKTNGEDIWNMSDKDFADKYGM